MFCRAMTYQGKDVVIAMLSGNYKQMAFTNFGDVCAIADKIEHKTARCLTCDVSPAPFTVRISPLPAGDEQDVSTHLNISEKIHIFL